ncbi:hypothetical protein, partial [Treponema sp. R80B11-R83G3]
YMIFSETRTTYFQFMSFVRNHAMNGVGYIGVILHYFFLLFFTLFFLYYQLSVNTPLKYALISKKLIIEETLVVISITSIIPGIFLYIHGGSAVYFSYFQELIAICMLLGFNIPEKLQEKIQTRSVMIKTGIVFFLFILSFVVLINSKLMYPIIRIMRTQNNKTASNLLTNVRDMIKISRNEKKKYCIFLDDNAEIWEIYKHNETAMIFFYPALTGIRIINGVYTDGTDIFLANGTNIQNIESSYYGINKNLVIENINGKKNFTSKLAFDEAKDKAKRNGYKYIIYIYNDKYEIIEI